MLKGMPAVVAEQRAGMLKRSKVCGRWNFVWNDESLRGVGFLG